MVSFKFSFIVLFFLISFRALNGASFVNNSFSTFPVALLQKECEICFIEVNFTECMPCCSNSHQLHFSCFQNILNQDDRKRLHCPLCREEFIHSVSELFDLFLSTDSKLTAEHQIIRNHLDVFKIIKPDEVSSQNWSLMFKDILTKNISDPIRLNLFFDLNVINDINITFNDDSCAISALIHKIQTGNDDVTEKQIRKDMLTILLNNPQLILDRKDPQTERHIIYNSIDASLFDVFLKILDASPQVNITDVFNYLLEFLNRENFIAYILEHRSSNIIFS